MKVFCTFILAALVWRSQTARILVWQPFSLRSHQNTFIPIIGALAERGHQVTYLTNHEVRLFPSNASNTVHQIVLDREVKADFVLNQLHILFGNTSWLDAAMESSQKLSTYSGRLTEAIYQHPDIQALISGDENFDLMLLSPFFGMTGYPLSWYFEAPMIFVTPNSLMPGLASILGDSDHTAYVPYLYGLLSGKLTLMQRLSNTISSFVHEIFMNSMHHSTVHNLVQHILPGCPPLAEIEKDVSLVLTNSHPVFNYPRPLPPQVIEIGGIHCRPANPLPTELEQFVSSSEAGFIVFAIGSALDMNDIPADIIQSFIAVFSRLPQRVIWQWKGTPYYNFPANVKTVTWLPQQDLLGHENCRLFLTHGGLSSLQEAVYHKVPVLGLPVAADQNVNIDKAVETGYALSLQWRNINQNNLNDTIQELLFDKKYSNNVRLSSHLLKSHLHHPLDKAVFWIESVLRHNGARHLHLGSRHLSLLQRSLIDVYVIMISIISIIVFSTIIFFRAILQFFSKNKTYSSC